MSGEPDIAEREFDEVAEPDADTAVAPRAGAAPLASPDAGLDADPELPAHVPRVTAGPLAEPEDAWLRYRAEVARYYGAVGPVELALVDRIVALQARIRRIEVAERGALMVATVGLPWKRTVNRVRSGDRDWHRSRMDTDGVLGATNPVTVRRALNDLRAFLDTLVDGELPDLDTTMKVLIAVYGCQAGREVKLQGHGEQIAFMVALARTPPPEDLPDREAMTARMVAAVHSELRKTEGMLVGLMASLEEEERQMMGAVLDAKAQPDLAGSRALVQLERHLQASVKEAVRELERMVARRRLAAMGWRA